MYSSAFSILFIGFLAVSVIVQFWLASRQIRHILTHRNAVPPQFSEKIPLAAHQKAADYTIAKTKFGLLNLLVGTVVLIGFTLLGGLQSLSNALLDLLGHGIARANRAVGGIRSHHEHHRFTVRLLQAVCAGRKIRFQQDDAALIRRRHGQGRIVGRRHRLAADLGDPDLDGQGRRSLVAVCMGWCGSASSS